MCSHFPKSILFLLLGAGPLYAENKLKKLEPLIGSWQCKTDSANIESKFRWILGKNFIEHDHELRAFGKTQRVKEIIGWDPQSQSIKGWIFTNFGIATSSYLRLKDAQGWRIEVELTRTDGTKSRKNKTLSIDDKKMSVRNDTAPLGEFRRLEFQRRQNQDLPENDVPVPGSAGVKR